MNKGVIFDRDGTLTKGIADHPDLVEFYEDTIEFLRYLNIKGYKILVATNQGGVSLGYISLKEIESVHKKINILLNEYNINVDKFYISTFHENGKQHKAGLEEDRKPNPGMLIKAKNEFDLDMENSWMVGDRFSDINAGISAGCKTALILRGCFAKDNLIKTGNNLVLPDKIITSLSELKECL